MRIRVIPVLLLKEGLLYKTIKFKNPQYIGDPVNTIKIFNDKEVDEIVVLDINASKKGTEPDYQLIEEMVSQAFMPIAYGGGIKTFEQAQRVFNTGVEKIIINSAALNNSELIEKIAYHYGAQSVALAVDVKKSLFTGYKIYEHVQNKTSYVSLKKYLSMINTDTVGELLVNNVDREGTFNGYDLDLAKEIQSALNIPVVMCGGARELEDFSKIKKIGLSGAAAGSMFIYKRSKTHNAVLINYPDYNSLENL